MQANQDHLHALEAAIASADAALDVLTEAEQAHSKALKALCTLSGVTDYGAALSEYQRLKCEQRYGLPINTGNGDDH